VVRICKQNYFVYRALARDEGRKKKRRSWEKKWIGRGFLYNLKKKRGGWGWKTRGIAGAASREQENAREKCVISHEKRTKNLPNTGGQDKKDLTLV